MADDIVQRLVLFVHDEQRMPAGMIRDVMAEIERLRAVGDALAKVSALDLCDCDNKDCTALRDAVKAWQEARS